MFDAIKGFIVSDGFWAAFSLLVVIVLIVSKLIEKSIARNKPKPRSADSSEYYDGCAEYYEDLDSFSTRK